MGLFLGTNNLLTAGAAAGGGGSYARATRFTASGTFNLATNNVPVGSTIGILVVGGGSSGDCLAWGVAGVGYNATGGNGGLVHYLDQVTTGTGDLTITVGAGGTAVTCNGTSGAGGTPPNTRAGNAGGASSVTGQGTTISSANGFSRGYGSGNSLSGGGSSGLSSPAVGPTCVGGFSCGGSGNAVDFHGNGLAGTGNGGRGGAGRRGTGASLTSQAGGSGFVVIFFNPVS